MSASSLAKLAVARDKKPHGTPIKPATDVLAATIPSEALAAYTTLIGIVLAANIGSAYGAFRWTAYGAFVALAVLAPLAAYKHHVSATEKQFKRRLPVLECFAAGIAAAAWGLVMPANPLSIVLHSHALVFATTAIALGAAAIISFVTKPLGTANEKLAPDSPPPPAGQ